MVSTPVYRWYGRYSIAPQPAGAGSPSPPPDSACYTTCAALCTTRQPNSANRIRYPAPKPASHQPIRQPSHNIKQGGGPTSSHIYTAAETPPTNPGLSAAHMREDRAEAAAVMTTEP